MKLLLCDANYDRKNNDSTNALRPHCFRCFQKCYMILFYMLDTLYLSSFFPSITFISYVLSYRKMERGPMNNARD